MTMPIASKLRLRRKAVLAGAACFLSFSASFLAASAADLFAGRWTVATSNVTAQTTFDPTAILRIGEDNAFSKTGAGRWLVPAASASQAWPLELSVKEGELEFTDAAVTAPATGASVTPPAVLQTAAIWFEANEDSFVTTTEHGSGDGVTYVHQWRDMRETAAADEAPAYFYAQSYYSHTNEAPTFTTYEGFPALYFGGVTSGKCMEIFTNGTVEAARTFTSIFVVHGVERTHGWLLGMTAGQSNAGGSYNIQWGKYGITDINWNVMGEYVTISQDGQSAGPVSRSVAMWWNGRKCDFRTQKVRTGQQLYELAWNGPGACFNTLFCERRNWSATVGYRQGGDYITALVAFKRQIPEDDRVRVRDYLMRKFLPASALAATTNHTYTIAPAATVTCDASVDGVTTLRGEGVLAKTGSGNRVFGGMRGGDAFAGEIDLQEGKATFQQEIPVKVSAGTRITAEVPSRVKNFVYEGSTYYNYGATGIVVTATADAPAGAFVKDGSGVLAVREVPASVSTVAVTGGTLRISARRTSSAPLSTNTPVSVAISNPSFENGTTGWTKLVCAAGTANSQWASTKCPNVNYAPYPAPDGEYMMNLKAGVGMSQDVSIPETGTYELSFFAGARAAQGHWSDLYLVEKSTGTTNWFARAGGIATGNPTSPARIFCRVKVETPGAYTLVFAAPETTTDYAMAVDDVKMVRVDDDPDHIWRIPYGDFERFEWGREPFREVAWESRYFHNGNTVPGWTFTEAEGADHSASWFEPGVGIVWIGHMLPGGFNSSKAPWIRSGITCSYWMNVSRPRETGVGQVLFTTNGASASTTFTPPAGVYQLRMHMGWSHHGSGGIHASLAIGGETIDLGTVMPLDNGRDMRPYQWPVAFAADGATAMTLTLAPSGMVSGRFGPAIDNVCLSSRINLVEDGGFEKDVGWIYGGNNGWEGGIGARNAYAGNEGHWGSDVWDGEYHAYIMSTGWVQQTVTVPAAGAYRFSFATRDRTEEGFPTWRSNERNLNLVRVTLTPEGGTDDDAIEFGRFDAASDRFVRHESVAFVPSKGRYTLSLRGTYRTYYYPMFDDIRLENVVECADAAPSLPKTLAISLADGATLDLDYIGTNRIDRLEVAGAVLIGVVSAENCPAVTGTGALEILPKGTMLIVR